jgi:AraC family transcriptional regulator
LPGPSTKAAAPPLIRRYDAETLSRRCLEGKGFRAESSTEDVTGHCGFDVQYPHHMLTLTPDGAPASVRGRIDGGALERFSVRPGQLTLMSIGQRFRGYTDGVGIRGELILFLEPELVAQAADPDIDAARVGMVRSTDLPNPTILQAMGALSREIRHPGPMGRVYTESLVWLTLAELVRHHSTFTVAPRPAQRLQSRRLARTIDYIESFLGEDLSLVTLATEAGVSPPCLAKEFKRAMGEPLHRYLLGRRIRWAAALLASTEQSIADVALTTGFSSQAHLTTAFRRLCHTTPAAYRRDCY